MSFNLEDLRGPITSILTAPGVDLGTISAKRVRKQLLENTDLGLTAREMKERRTEVDKLISDVYENISRQMQDESKRKRDAETDEGTEQDDREEPIEGPDTEQEQDEDEDKPPPPKRKKKNTVQNVDADAELARKLSSEINSRARRGASNGAATPKKRKPKKSAKMVDSGDEDEDEEKPKKKRSGGARGGFAKEYMLRCFRCPVLRLLYHAISSSFSPFCSESLSVVVGVNKLSRPQVVKKLWEYIRGRELQNPSNKREIICDDAMRAVFGTEKIDMFRMNKVLGRYVYFGCYKPHLI